MPRIIELTFGFSNPYKQICSWKVNSMFNNPGTVTAREMRPYVKSQRDAARYAGFFNFLTLFVCLLTDMVRVPPEIRNILNRGHGHRTLRARASPTSLSSFARHR
jgi:hypothetical protein